MKFRAQLRCSRTLNSAACLLSLVLPSLNSLLLPPPAAHLLFASAAARLHARMHPQPSAGKTGSQPWMKKREMTLCSPPKTVWSRRRNHHRCSSPLQASALPRV